MSHQLWYTSAERGLSAGSRGFCTVKATRGIPQPLAQRLESLSGYTHLYAPQENGNPDNPVAYHFIQLYQGGRTWYVLSRICDAGRDYSGRTNKFAHHIVLDHNELPPAGPAWLMSQPGFFDATWDGVVGVVDGGKPIPRQDVAPRPCARWQAAAGDAGWAGIVAESALDAEGPPVHIIVPAGLPVLPLLEESLALLPPELRWSLTFSTFYSDQFPADVSVRWRVLIDGTREAIRAAAVRHQPVIDLTRPGPVPIPRQTSAVEAARRGTFLQSVTPAVANSTRRVFAPVKDADLGVYPTNRPVRAAAPPVAHGASRPPELGRAEPPAIVPIGDAKRFSKGRVVRDTLLIASVPLMILGIALAIAAQYLELLPKLSKMSTVAASAGGEKSGAKAGQQTEATESSSAPQNRQTGGERTAAEAPSEQESQSKGTPPPTTPPPSSAPKPEAAETTQAVKKPSGGEASEGPNGKIDPPQPPEANPEPAPKAAPEASQALEERPSIFDATIKPQWSIREIRHDLSSFIRIGVIEECRNDNGNAPSVGNKQDPEHAFNLLIDGERLILLSSPPAVTDLRMEQRGESVAQGTMPGGKSLGCGLILSAPKEIIAAFSDIRGGGVADAELDVQVTLNEMCVALAVSEKEQKGGAKARARGMTPTWEYRTQDTWTESLGLERTSKLVKFAINGKDDQRKEQAPDSFECDVKVVKREGEGIAIEIGDPIITMERFEITGMKVTQARGSLTIDVVLNEPPRSRIRIVNQEWKYPSEATNRN